MGAFAGLYMGLAALFIAVGLSALAAFCFCCAACELGARFNEYFRSALTSEIADLAGLNYLFCHADA
jgi:hypothetical protein